MSLPYELVTEQHVTVGSETLLINAPDFQRLVRLMAIGPAAFDMAAYNRQLVGATVVVDSVTDDGNGKALLNLAGPLPVHVSDPILVAGNSVGGYNTTHRVVSQSPQDQSKILTASSFTSVGTGGTAKISITGADVKLYTLVPSFSAAAGVATYESEGGVHLINMDPYITNKPKSRGLYVSVSAAGTYRFALRFVGPETFG